MILYTFDVPDMKSFVTVAAVKCCLCDICWLWL